MLKKNAKFVCLKIRNFTLNKINKYIIVGYNDDRLPAPFRSVQRKVAKPTFAFYT